MRPEDFSVANGEKRVRAQVDPNSGVKQVSPMLITESVSIPVVVRAAPALLHPFLTTW